MDKRYRVYNDRKYHIGLALQNGLERVVNRGSFTSLTRDEIEYAASISPSLFFKEKQLRLDDRELALELGFVEELDAPRFDETEIRKNLSARTQQMGKWLEGITEPYLLDLVYDVARTMDLAASKLKLLQAKMPDKEFVGSDDA